MGAADRKAVCETRAALGETDLPDAWGSTGRTCRAGDQPSGGQAALSIRVVGGAMTVRRLAQGKLDIDRTVALGDGERAALRDAGAAVWGGLGPVADAPTFAACTAPNYIVAETNLNSLVNSPSRIAWR